MSTLEPLPSTSKSIQPPITIYVTKEKDKENRDLDENDNNIIMKVINLYSESDETNDEIEISTTRKRKAHLIDDELEIGNSGELLAGVQTRL